MQQAQTYNSDDDTPAVGHNSGSLLNSFVERIEHIQEEVDAFKQDQKEVYSEAKSIGFDVKILRKVVTRRKMDREKRQEEDELLSLYEDALAGLREMME